MVRRFVYLLLVAFTLQLSWGTIAAYCEHESGRAARHLGHHEHSPATADAADAASTAASDHGDQSGAAKKSAGHTHCSSCSHAALAAIELDGGHAHPQAIAIAAAAPIIRISSAYLAPPERPQWLHAA
ncbi:hypothetical protein ACHMW6_31160 [Pseudoduganella sp. UC29_106]|uniref:hypothetical protein n=1 Tax=Pseudoduganella sp. UC29_106 TaxID=3374553 RepID=UPI003756D8E3